MRVAALTSGLLLLASSVVALPQAQGFTPLPQGQAVPPPPPGSNQPAPPPAPAEDKSKFITDNGLAVALWDAVGNEDIMFLNEQALLAGNRDMIPINTGFLYDRLEIIVGKNFRAPTTRCQILDGRGNPIFAKRNANLDTTFADGNGGKWDIVRPSQVHALVCDPGFKACDRNQQASCP